MPTLEQQLADAIKAQNDLTQAVALYKSQIDSAVASQKQAYDAWKAGARGEYLLMRRHALQTATIDKAWFNLSDPANIDSVDKSMSKWKYMGIGQVYGNEGCVVNVDTSRCYMHYPGHYESPQYSTDKSSSRWQFVLANSGATSDQINQRIKDTGLNIPLHGGWSDDAQMLKTTCIQVPNVHPYSGLWVRLVNVVVSGSGAPQEVSKFGGSPALSARFAEIYPNIPY